MPDAAPPAPRILAVRFSSIGDILLTTPLFRAIRTRHPTAHLTVLTKMAYRPLLSENPNLDEVLALEDHATLWELARRIRREAFTHRLDLHGNLRSRLLQALAPGRWDGYSPRRLARWALITFKRNWYPPEGPPTAERYFEAARRLDVEPDGHPAEFFLRPDARTSVETWLGQRGLGRGRPLVAVAPRARHETKCWPVARWAALVQALAERDCDAVVIGGPEDRTACETVAQAGGNRAASTAGMFGLQESGAVIQRANVAAAGDSGPMHMATALGTPVVALFGPTVEPFGFFPYRAEAHVLERDLPCRPCSKMGGPSCPLGHHRCLLDIPAKEVLDALGSWL